MRRLALLLVAGAMAVVACSGPPEQAASSPDGGDGAPRPSAVATTAAAEPVPGALVDRLRAGGLAIVIRHGHTDSTQDASPIDISDCST